MHLWKKNYGSTRSGTHAGKLIMLPVKHSFITWPLPTRIELMYINSIHALCHQKCIAAYRYVVIYSWLWHLNGATCMPWEGIPKGQLINNKNFYLKFPVLVFCTVLCTLKFSIASFPGPRPASCCLQYNVLQMREAAGREPGNEARCSIPLKMCYLIGSVIHSSNPIFPIQFLGYLKIGNLIHSCNLAQWG